MKTGFLKILFGIVIMLMFSILIAIDHAWFLLIAVAGGFWLYYSGLKSIIKKELTFRSDSIELINKLPDEEKFVLNFDRKVWRGFAEEETKLTAWMPWISASFIFIVMGMGCGMAIFNSDASPNFIFVMLSVVGPISLGVWLYAKDQSQAKINAFIGDFKPEVIISRQGIVINQQLVYGLGNEKRLQGFEPASENGTSVLKINYLASSGNQQIEQSYHFPLPLAVDRSTLNAHFELGN